MVGRMVGMWGGRWQGGCHGRESKTKEVVGRVERQRVLQVKEEEVREVCQAGEEDGWMGLSTGNSRERNAVSRQKGDTVCFWLNSYPRDREGRSQRGCRDTGWAMRVVWGLSGAVGPETAEDELMGPSCPLSSLKTILHPSGRTQS